MSAENPISIAVGLLRQTERRFQELIAEASSEGQYPDVMRLACAAEEINQLAERVSAGPNQGERSSSSPKSSQESRKGKKHKLKYPKFFGSGDELIKVGWSKKKKKEYRHTAPHRLALPLTKAIVQAGGAEAKVATNDFFPIEDPKDHSEVPSYQSYIVLAWLVEAGIVEKHGRQGYTIPHPDSLRKQIDEQWGALAPAPS